MGKGTGQLGVEEREGLPGGSPEGRGRTQKNPREDLRTIFFPKEKLKRS